MCLRNKQAICKHARPFERIAAWLAGSHARGEQQWFSDLDLHVVVAEAYSEILCAQPWSVGAKTTPERLALFSQFGEPAVIEDNIGETRAALKGERTHFTKASRIKLSCTREEQIATLRSLCDEMESLMPQVIALGGVCPCFPTFRD